MESGARARVVVAEDEALIRLDLVEMLTDAGYDVVAAVQDGAAAVERAVALNPDLCLFDVKMPKLDGIAAAGQVITACSAGVVLLTAFSDRTLVEQAALAGVVGYLVKPVSEADLIPTMDVALARTAQMHALASEVASLQERLAARATVERAKGELQARLGLTEAQAFRWLQKRAMDRRLSLREVAQVVLDGLDPATD